ncbi:polar amino acid transport system substrate-binding protein [Catenulispora sp. GAS73]
MTPGSSVPRRRLLRFGTLLATLMLAGCTTVSAPQARPAPVPVPVPNDAAVLPMTGDTIEPVRTTQPPCANSPGSNPWASFRPPSPMPTPGDMPTGSAMRAIQDRGYLIVGVDQDQFHMSARNLSLSPPAGEQYSGFDVDMVHAVAAAIFGKDGADNIKYMPVTLAYRMGAVYQGVVDMVADSVTITCGRWAQVDFSVSYLAPGQRLLVPRSDTAISLTLDANGVPHVAGLTGKKVCTIGSSTSQGNLGALETGGGFRIVLAENWSDCIVLLQQGQVSAISTDDTLLHGITVEDPYLKVVGQRFSYEPLGFVFPRTDPSSADNSQFVGFTNGVITRLESADRNGYCPEAMTNADTTCWSAIYRTWLGSEVPAPPPIYYLP